MCASAFVVTSDRDAFDYIYSVSYLNELHHVSSNQSNGARLLRIFSNKYPDHECKCYLLSAVDACSLHNVYIEWAQAKKISHVETNEYRAFEKLLQTKHENIHAQLIYLSGALKGFQLFEVLSPQHAIVHFCKADVAYNGIYDALMWCLGKVLFERKVKFCNFEQDLGIQNLRRAKEKYKVDQFLKKFIVYNR